MMLTHTFKDFQTQVCIALVKPQKTKMSLFLDPGKSSVNQLILKGRKVNYLFFHGEYVYMMTFQNLLTIQPYETISKVQS